MSTVTLCRPSCLCCEVVDLHLFVAEVRSRLPCQSDSSPHGPVILSQQQAENLILTDHVVSNLLPSKTIINCFEPLKSMEANLEVLHHRGLTWIVDRKIEPPTISLCTTPYAVPYCHDALHFHSNIFGHSLASVCTVFLVFQGYLIFYTYVDPVVWPGLRQICQNNSKVSFYQDYCEELVLETDL